MCCSRDCSHARAIADAFGLSLESNHLLGEVYPEECDATIFMQ